MQIKMIARGVETTFVLNTAADFAAVEERIEALVESHNWGYSWLGLWMRLDIEERTSTASIYDCCGISFDSIEMLAAGRSGQKMACSEWLRGEAGSIDFGASAKQMLKKFFAECLFQTVMEWNKQDDYTNIALRGAISEYLHSSDYGRQLIESIIDPVKN